MTPAELDKLVPEITMSKYLQAQAPAGYTVTKVNVYNSKYFKGLSGILKAADRKTLHDYLQWGLMRALLDGVHKDFTAPIVQFSSLKAGKGAKDPEFNPERWKTCLTEIDTELSWLQSSFFVQRAFSKEAKAYGERIIGEIENVYVEKLQAPSWLSPAMKTFALNKGKTDSRFDLILLCKTNIQQSKN
jgi:endothelin-converting enzyme